MQANEKISLESLILELENEIKNPPEKKKIESINAIIQDLMLQRNGLNVFKIIQRTRLMKKINVQKQEIQKIQNEIEINKCKKKKRLLKLKLQNGCLKKYDTLVFGNYHGDIEWLILAIEKDKVLLISKYIVDCMPYHYSKDAVAWDNSSIRNWLNFQFINTAFTKDEQREILVTSVSPDRNFILKEGSASLISNTYQGGYTKDKLFLLSLLEVKKYFDDDTKLYTTKTPYAERKAPDNKVNMWWLRTVHKFFMGNIFMGYNATSVLSATHEISDIGYSVDMDMIGIRPAMWMNLSE